MLEKYKIIYRLFIVNVIEKAEAYVFILCFCHTFLSIFAAIFSYEIAVADIFFINFVIFPVKIYVKSERYVLPWFFYSILLQLKHIVKTYFVFFYS